MYVHFIHWVVWTLTNGQVMIFLLLFRLSCAST
jgi:hypothetical protein